MCKFCENLEWRNYKVPLRNWGSDDNTCEFGSPESYDGEVIGYTCSDCDGCSDDNLYFRMRTYDNRIGFDFYHKVKGLVIDAGSEMFDINFCPWCGGRLSSKMVDFDKCCLGKDLKLM